MWPNPQSRESLMENFIFCAVLKLYIHIMLSLYALIISLLYTLNIPYN